MSWRASLSDKWREVKGSDSVMWLIALGHTFTHWVSRDFYLLLPFLVKELGRQHGELLSASQSLLSSLSPVICGFIADRWGILATFYFPAGTVLLANFVVMAIPEEKKEAAAVVEEPVQAS